MSRHAYLIIAHNDFEVLHTLIKAIDDTRNDIYLHIDKKVQSPPHIVCKYAKLYQLSKRIDVRWGDYSIVETELLLFEEAASHGPYNYYHLLSGVDLPIKSQDYIHNYCNTHQGKEFIGYATTTQDELYWRVQHYFLFPRLFKSKNIIIRGIRKATIKAQDFIKYKRTKLSIRKGPQWCSLTHSFICYVLSNKDLIYKTFNHTYCPDELFIQTLCWNSKYRNNIYNLSDEFEGCKRYIKWKNGELLLISDDDIEEMRRTSKWYARKFSHNTKEICTSVIR
ncbi:MAG: glycosyl transferase [Bacteroidaceae bacterium]|nr:glycosyl transferase [Bacteroidaceae bacterium]